MDLTGRNIAFTGIASGYTREQIHATIRQYGGVVASSVNATTDLLVIGEDPGKGQSKRERALELGVPTVQAGAFMAKVRNSGPAWGFPEPAAKAAKAAKKREKNRKVVAHAVTRDLPPLPGFVGF